MKFEHLDIGGRKFSTLRGEQKCPEYMMKMLMINNPRNIIPFSFLEKGLLQKVLYETDINKTVREYLMENGADEQWIKNFLIITDMLLSRCGEYLIDPSFIMTETDKIFCSMDNLQPLFVFNPFEKHDFNEAIRKTVADIAGNYFIDHAVSGEIFRERLLREAGKKDFNIRNIISRWDELSYSPNEPAREPHTHSQKTASHPEFFKSIFEKLHKKEEPNTTVAIKNTTGHMVLTGICSINTRIPVKDEGITVGRSMLHKEFGLYNSGIGKTHARVYSRDGIVYATDLGSKNGTYLNGEQLDKRVPAKMERGDILAFSDEEFILC